jgi:hypothetical protein
LADVEIDGRVDRAVVDAGLVVDVRAGAAPG